MSRHSRDRRCRRARDSRCLAHAATRSSAGSVRPRSRTGSPATHRARAAVPAPPWPATPHPACSCRSPGGLRDSRRMRQCAMSMALHHAGRQQIKAGTERPHRAVVTADQQDAINTRLDPSPQQEIVGLGEARQSPHRDVRHRIKPGAMQPCAGGDDVMVRHAGRVVDEYRRARIEQPPQRIAGEFVARRQFDRTSADQLCHRWLRGVASASISRNPACARSRRIRPRTTGRHARAAPPWSRRDRRRC